MSNNSARFEGGGITNFSSGTTEVTNTTIGGNSASGSGGGIFNFNFATVSLVFSTLTLNQAANGGGVFNDTRGTARVRNTIIAANLNSSGGVNPDVSGNFTSDGYNLIGDATGSSGFDATGDIVGTSTNPIDPRLAALSFNGGPTATNALLSDSPAIDAGDPNLLATDPTTDQRGNPRVSGARADIGAFELTFA